MALTERDILGNAGALRVALNSLASSDKKEIANAKQTVEEIVQLLVGGLLCDINRIANSLEEMVRLEQNK